jgi:hypothetical protein
MIMMKRLVVCGSVLVACGSPSEHRLANVWTDAMEPIDEVAVGIADETGPDNIEVAAPVPDDDTCQENGEPADREIKCTETKYGPNKTDSRDWQAGSGEIPAYKDPNGVEHPASMYCALTIGCDWGTHMQTSVTDGACPEGCSLYEGGLPPRGEAPLAPGSMCGSGQRASATVTKYYRAFTNILGELYCYAPEDLWLLGNAVPFELFNEPPQAGATGKMVVGDLDAAFGAACDVYKPQVDALVLAPERTFAAACYLDFEERQPEWEEGSCAYHFSTGVIDPTDPGRTRHQYLSGFDGCGPGTHCPPPGSQSCASAGAGAGYGWYGTTRCDCVEDTDDCNIDTLITDLGNDAFPTREAALKRAAACCSPSFASELERRANGPDVNAEARDRALRAVAACTQQTDP